MTPMPALCATQLEVVERPGVDGSAFWDMGRKGQPCTVRTAVDAASIDAAQTLFKSYVDVIDEAPVEVVFAGKAFSSLGSKYQVLAVRCLTVAACSAIVGGLNQSSLAWLEAEWTLKPVPA